MEVYMNNSIVTVSVNSLEDSKTLVKCLKKSKLGNVAITIQTHDSSLPMLDDPNTRFSAPKYLGEWKTQEDCQSFFEKYNKDNNYEGLNLGDYVKIFSRDEDHTYEWMIAGFDYYEESFGPGIVFIPRISIGAYIMNTISTTKGGYYGSDMQIYLMDLINGDYDVISKSIITDSEPLIMLMSDIQVYGESMKFDRSEDLEALYQADTRFDKGILPIFNYISPIEYSNTVLSIYHHPYSKHFWLRAVASSATFALANDYGFASAGGASGSYGLRPLIYLR
jgi:hypothetical protein